MDLRIGYDKSRNPEARDNQHGGNIHLPGKHRQVSKSGTNIIKPDELDSSPSMQGSKNSRMNWMMRKGEGGIGGSRRGSQSQRLGAMIYPPLPKWMERLPGRRSASGGLGKIQGVC